MGERTPHPGLLAEALHKVEVMVGEGAELLHHLLVLIAVLVRADVDIGTPKHRVVALKILGKEGVEESVYVGVEKIKMIQAPLF